MTSPLSANVKTKKSACVRMHMWVCACVRERERLRIDALCSFLLSWPCDTIQMHLGTHTHTQIQASRCQSYCHRLDPLVCTDASVLCPTIRLIQNCGCNLALMTNSYISVTPDSITHKLHCVTCMAPIVRWLAPRMADCLKQLNFHAGSDLLS